MHGGPPGFHNAPVSRAIVTTSAILSIVHGFAGRSFRLGLSQDIIKNHHLWRIIPSVFAFSSSPELIFGLYLLYYFRVFERQIGSNKYAVFVLFSGIFSTVLELSILVLLKDPKFSTLASGPYGLIFASFVPFFIDIPVTSRFRILGVNFSNKTGIYLTGLQLLLSLWKRSLIPGICGLLAGSLYRVNAFGIRRLKFPEKVASFFSRWLVSSSASSSRAPPNIRRNAQFSGNSQIQRNYPSTAHMNVMEPPESSIALLVSMGFDGNAARQALMQARNDLDVATNILLEAQSR